MRAAVISDPTPCAMQDNASARMRTVYGAEPGFIRQTYASRSEVELNAIGWNIGAMRAVIADVAIMEGCGGRSTVHAGGRRG